jgi:hypothetical protein
MCRAARFGVAAILALAVAALPVMLDRCAESCETHQATVASTPACHHTTSTGTHITDVPTPCGHDHSGSAVTAAKSVAPIERASVLLATTGSPLPVAPPAGDDVRVDPHSRPDSSPPFAGRSLPLRI